MKSFRRFLPVYAANLFLSFHYAVIVYVNSSYLGTFVSQRTIGLLYIIASLINIAIFISIPKILQKISLKEAFLIFGTLDLLATAGMGLLHSHILIPILFIIYDTCVIACLFCLDVFLEHHSQDATTGRIRSRYLTIANTAILFSPLFAGFVVGPNDYWKAYVLSAFFLVIMISLGLASLRGRITLDRAERKPMETMRLFMLDPAMRKILGANFLLQFFYSWMVIYMPIYLHQYLGFTWQAIGLLFTIMLLPFVLFEIPVGKIVDTITGEKEFLAAGFIIMAVFTFFIPFIPQWQIFIWAFVLFMTRVGASFVEVTTESYFFKHVNSKQSGFIGIFRLSEPLANIMGPLSAIIALYFLPFQYVFIVLAALMLLGLRFAFALKDTR